MMKEVSKSERQFFVREGGLDLKFSFIDKTVQIGGFRDDVPFKVQFDSEGNFAIIIHDALPVGKRFTLPKDEMPELNYNATHDLMALKYDLDNVLKLVVREADYKETANYPKSYDWYGIKHFVEDLSRELKIVLSIRR